jgi:hypothetical protein
MYCVCVVFVSVCVVVFGSVCVCVVICCNKRRPGDRKPVCLARLYVAREIVIVPKHVVVNFV